MQLRIADLRNKEVVNISDGQKLGNVEDVLVETGSGRVVALVVPGPCRVLGLLFPSEDYIIPWESILRIGDDLILIDLHDGCDRCRKPRKPLF